MAVRRTGMHRLVTVTLLVAPACVLEPSWGESSTRRDPIDFSGTASRANAPLRVQAWNHDASGFETVASFTGGTTRYATEPDLYGWSRPAVRLADRYWVPTGFGCASGGMANLRVQEINSDGTTRDLATFDQAGKDCLYDQIGDGAHPVAAGNACKLEDETIVLFSPPQCVSATASDATPPLVTVRLANATSVWERSTGETAVSASPGRGSRLTATALVRDLDGGAPRAQLTGEYTVICRRASDGATTSLRHPISTVFTRPFTLGAATDVTAETTWLVDVPTIVASECAAGYVFSRLDGFITASGTNTTGTTATSPRLGFSI